VDQSRARPADSSRNEAQVALNFASFVVGTLHHDASVAVADLPFPFALSLKILVSNSLERIDATESVSESVR